MTVEMKLQKDPFEKIRAGHKTIELRLYDEKRQKLKVGDQIEFTNMADPSQKILTQVLALHIFRSFDEMFQALPATSMGYGPDQNPDPKDMEAYYSKDEQAQYGVVGIELFLL